MADPLDHHKLTLLTLPHEFIGKPLLTKDLRVLNHLIYQILSGILVKFVKLQSQSLYEIRRILHHSRVANRLEYSAYNIWWVAKIITELVIDSWLKVCRLGQSDVLLGQILRRFIQSLGLITGRETMKDLERWVITCSLIIFFWLILSLGSCMQNIFKCLTDFRLVVAVHTLKELVC